MRWRWLMAELICAAAIAPAYADRKSVIKNVSDGYVVVTTNYVQGNNWRWQSEVLLPAADVPRSLVSIVNGDRGSYYVLDLNAKRYVEPQRVEPILTLAMWLRRAPRIAPSGRTVHMYFEAIDTGESRQMFGRMARHFIVRERTVAEPGACLRNSTVEKDGWYIASPQGKVRYESSLRVGGARECRDTVVVHGTQPELGFALLEKQTIRPPVPDGYPVRSYTRTQEVLEFAEQPLDKRLFEPPKDFLRVDVLPGERPVSWTQRLEWNWRELEQSLESWFE